MISWQGLRKKGYRQTLRRKMIYGALSKVTKPVTVNELLKFFSEDEFCPNQSTVYRTLHLLVKEKIAREVSFNDKNKRYELIDKVDHHHHLVCKTCGKIIKVVVPKENAILIKLSQSFNFTIEDHQWEFFGSCENCKKNV